jgi:hypothetical protein
MPSASKQGFPPAHCSGERFPSTAQAVAGIPAEAMLIDGEAVALDADSGPGPARVRLCEAGLGRDRLACANSQLVSADVDLLHDEAGTGNEDLLIAPTIEVVEAVEAGIDGRRAARMRALAFLAISISALLLPPGSPVVAQSCNLPVPCGDTVSSDEVAISVTNTGAFGQAALFRINNEENLGLPALEGRTNSIAPRAFGVLGAASSTDAGHESAAVRGRPSNGPNFDPAWLTVRAQSVIPTAHQPPGNFPEGH